MIPDEIADNLERLTFGDLIDFMMLKGFSRQTHGKTRGSWAKSDLKQDHSTLIGVSYKTFEKALNNSGNLRKKTCNAIITFFLAEIKNDNAKYNKWFELSLCCIENTKKITKGVSTTGNQTGTETTSLWPNWVDCFEDWHPVYKKLCQHLDTCQDRVFLIVTISPEGFMPLMKRISKAVKQGRADVMWAYHPHNNWSHGSEIESTVPAEQLNTLELQRLTHMSTHGTLTGKPDEIKDRHTYENLLIGERDEISREKEKNSKIGQFIVFESRIFHYFMGFISLPRNSCGANDSQDIASFCDISDVFGFAQLYVHFPRGYFDRPALFFEGDDEVSSLYASSVRNFFSTASQIPFWDKNGANNSYEALRVKPD